MPLTAVNDGFVGLLGRWRTSPDNPSSKRTCWESPIARVRFTGTWLQVTIEKKAEGPAPALSGIYCYVDGGDAVFTRMDTPYSSTTTIQILAGLANTTHDVVVQFVEQGYGCETGQSYTDVTSFSTDGTFLPWAPRGPLLGIAGDSVSSIRDSWWTHLTGIEPWPITQGGMALSVRTGSGNTLIPSMSEFYPYKVDMSFPTGFPSGNAIVASDVQLAGMAVLLGFNDASYSVQPLVFKTKMKSFIAAVRAVQGNIPFVLLTSFAVTNIPGAGAYRIVTAQIADEMSGVSVVDLGTDMPGSYPYWDEEGLTPGGDGIHTGTAGQKHIAAMAQPAVTATVIGQWTASATAAASSGVALSAQVMCAAAGKADCISAESLTVGRQMPFDFTLDIAEPAASGVASAVANARLDSHYNLAFDFALDIVEPVALAFDFALDIVEPMVTGAAAVLSGASGDFAVLRVTSGEADVLSGDSLTVQERAAASGTAQALTNATLNAFKPTQYAAGHADAATGASASCGVLAVASGAISMSAAIHAAMNARLAAAAVSVAAGGADLIAVQLASVGLEVDVVTAASLRLASVYGADCVADVVSQAEAIVAAEYVTLLTQAIAVSVPSMQASVLIESLGESPTYAITAAFLAIGVAERYYVHLTGSPGMAVPPEGSATNQVAEDGEIAWRT